MLTLCHNYFRVSPNNKNGKDGVQHFSKRKFAFGVFLLLLVVVLWVVSSELTKVSDIPLSLSVSNYCSSRLPSWLSIILFKTQTVIKYIIKVQDRIFFIYWNIIIMPNYIYFYILKPFTSHIRVGRVLSDTRLPKIKLCKVWDNILYKVV